MIKQYFADTCFLTGLYDENDQYHDLSQKIFDHLKSNRLISNINDLHTSNYIIMELMHNLKSNGTNIDKIKKYYEELMESKKVFTIKKAHIKEAIDTKLSPYCNRKTGEVPIGIVDATNLVVMDKIATPAIITYDGGFEEMFKKMPDFYFTINCIDVIDNKILKYL
jgi:predicted nucleic acid-binding protein